MEKPDLRNVSYEKFVEFLFDRTDAHWFWVEQLLFVGEEIANHYIRLFKNSSPLAQSYSPDQIEWACWAIQGGNLSCSAHRIIWDSSILRGLRQHCVRAMFDFFRDLLSEVELNTAVNMWWDCLVTDASTRFRKPKEDRQAIEQTVFETLCKILELESVECQGAASHGLGHLKYAGTKSVIRRYIAAHPEMPEDDVEYCEACITGGIM